MTREEKITDLKIKIVDAQKEADKYNALQLALKLVLNGTYGAFGNRHFIFSNPQIANAITSMGREIIQYMDTVNEKYWSTLWHIDRELHEHLQIETPRQINIENEPVSVYIDTDSTDRNSLIRTNNGSFTVEDLYNRCIQNGSAGVTLTGHESVKCNYNILNWEKSKHLYYAPVKRIIRHKVTKKKWKLKTKSGKEVIVTNDHSMIVFRDGKQLKVKPSEILKTDKILIILNDDKS